MAMKNIVHVVEATFAGVGRHVLDLAMYQSMRGSEVTVFYCTSRMSDSFAKQVKELDQIKWIELKATKKFRLVNIISAIRVARYCRKNRVEVLHGHSSIGGLIGRIAGLFCKATVMYTPNAFFSMNPTLAHHKKKVIACIERLLSVFSNHVICVSPEEIEHAKMYIKIAENKLRLIPNGIRPLVKINKTEELSLLGIDESSLIIGFVGRFDEQKSPFDLIKICQHVLKRNSDIKFVFAGDGPLLEKTKLFAKQKGIYDNVLFPGTVKGDRVIQTFDIFLLPSQYEGFPYVLLEAVSSSVPIVTTKGACASSLMKEDCGFIHEIGDIEGMAKSLLLLCDDSVLREKKSLNAKEVSEQFTIERMEQSISLLE